MKTLKVIGNFMKKEIDTPTFQLQLLEDGIPYIFTNNAIVRLIIEKTGRNVLNKLIEITDYNTGIVEFEVNEALGSGNYNCEIIVTEGNEIATFPTNGYQTFQINKNLDTKMTGETIQKSEYEIILERIGAVEHEMSNKSNVGHGHTILEITNLRAELDGKCNVGHGHTMNEIDGLNDAFQDHQNLLDALEVETDEMQTEILTLKGIDLVLQGSIETVQGNIDEIEGIFSGKNEEQDQEIATLKNTLKEKANEKHTHLTNEISGLDNTLQNHQNLIDALEEVTEQNKNENDVTRQFASEIQTKVNTLHGNINTIDTIHTAITNEHETKIGLLESEVENLNIKTSVLDNFETTLNKIDQLEKNEQTQNTTIQSLRGDIDNVSQQIGNIANLLDAINGEVI